MIEALVEGYEQAFEPDWNGEDDDDMPDSGTQGHPQI